MGATVGTMIGFSPRHQSGGYCMEAAQGNYCVGLIAGTMRRISPRQPADPHGAAQRNYCLGLTVGTMKKNVSAISGGPPRPDQ